MDNTSEKNHLLVKTVTAILLLIVIVSSYFIIASQFSRPSGSSYSPQETPEIALEAKKRALRRTFITVSSCRDVRPAVYMHTLGAPITFVNMSDKNHVIYFSPSETFTVPANGKIQHDFAWKTPGVRTFKCDLTKSAGTIYSEKPVNIPSSARQ